MVCQDNVKTAANRFDMLRTRPSEEIRRSVQISVRDLLPLWPIESITVMRDLDMSLDKIARLLVAQFGLTRSEAEVAVALNAGQMITEIAAFRAVSVHTVRNQVKSALSKTNSRRQAELTRLIETLRYT